MGSHTPPEDLKARFQGSEAARRSKKTIDNRFSLSVTERKREGVRVYSSLMKFPCSILKSLFIRIFLKAFYAAKDSLHEQGVW